MARPTSILYERDLDPLGDGGGKYSMMLSDAGASGRPRNPHRLLLDALDEVERPDVEEESGEDLSEKCGVER